jgi:membrane protein involved in colicin uptake
MIDITPEDSVVPIYLDPTPEAQQEADAINKAELEATLKAEAEAKAQAKAELLERLGITEDEAKLLLA